MKKKQLKKALSAVMELKRLLNTLGQYSETHCVDFLDMADTVDEAKGCLLSIEAILIKGKEL